MLEKIIERILRNTVLLTVTALPAIGGCNASYVIPTKVSPSRGHYIVPTKILSSGRYVSTEFKCSSQLNICTDLGYDSCKNDGPERYNPQTGIFEQECSCYNSTYASSSLPTYAPSSSSPSNSKPEKDYSGFGGMGKEGKDYSGKDAPSDRGGHWEKPHCPKIGKVKK